MMYNIDKQAATFRQIASLCKQFPVFFSVISSVFITLVQLLLCLWLLTFLMLLMFYVKIRSYVMETSKAADYQVKKAGDTQLSFNWESRSVHL